MILQAPFTATFLEELGGIGCEVTYWLFMKWTCVSTSVHVSCFVLLL